MKTRFAPVAAVTLVMLGLAGCGRWGEQERKVTIERGGRIVTALTEYEKRNAEYPRELSGLVPTYLTEILPPGAGNKLWRYVVSADGKYFELLVDDDSAVSGSTLEFDSRRGLWEFLRE